MNVVLSSARACCHKEVHTLYRAVLLCPVPGKERHLPSLGHAFEFAVGFGGEQAIIHDPCTRARVMRAQSIDIMEKLQTPPYRQGASSLVADLS